MEIKRDYQEYTERKGLCEPLTKYPPDAERLRKLIDESKYTIVQLSQMVSGNANSTCLYHWANGTAKRVRYKRAMKFCELFNVPYEYIFHPIFSENQSCTPVPFSLKPNAKKRDDRSDELEEIKKLLISINNGIANLCKKWE